MKNLEACLGWRYTYLMSVRNILPTRSWLLGFVYQSKHYELSLKYSCAYPFKFRPSNFF